MIGARRLLLALALAAILPAIVPAPAPVSAAGPAAVRPVVPLQPRPAESPTLTREVFGFASAGSLDDPRIGWRSWNLGLLTDVAFLAIHVAPDGTLVQSDTGWRVWHSRAAADLVDAAHRRGVRVLLTLQLLAGSAPDSVAMCETLGRGRTTIAAAARQLQGADGIDVDYEGTNVACPDGEPVSARLTRFVRELRRASLGRLVVDTYAGSPEDRRGFFDIPGLAPSVDAFFVMAYGLEPGNGPCGRCLGPTAPLGGSGARYAWTVTRAATAYAPWAGKSVMGLPYYGVAACVQGPNPAPNAPALDAGRARPSAIPYTAAASMPASNPSVSGWRARRDQLDPRGQQPWATYYSADPGLNCWREAYWDDAVSLGAKYALVNARRLRGAGIFTLDYGGGSPDLWRALARAFT